MDIQYVIISGISIILIALLAIFWPSIEKGVDESQVKFISEKMLPDDIAYTALPVNNVKAIVDQGDNLVKIIMNVKGKAHDKDWYVVDERVYEHGPLLPNQTRNLIPNPAVDPTKNKLEKNETQGMRSMGSLPGINKVLEYPLSWDTYINKDKDTGIWIIKERKNQLVKQAYFEAQYTFVFGSYTKDGYFVLFLCQFTVEMTNSYKAFYCVTIPGRWINAFSASVSSVVTDFGMGKDFTEIKNDASLADTKSILGAGMMNLNPTLQEDIGYKINKFELADVNWDKENPMFKAFSEIAIAQQEKLALEIKLAGKRMETDQKAYDTRETEIAKAAGKLEENKSEADLIKKKNKAAIELLNKQNEAAVELINKKNEAEVNLIQEKTAVENKAAIELLGKKNEAEVKLIQEKTAVENKAAIDLLKERYEARGKLVKELREKGVSEETIQAMFISEMPGLLSYGEKGVGLVTNVDDKKGGNKGDNKPVVPPAK